MDDNSHVNHTGPQTGKVRFGVFELDPRSSELRKRGLRIRLQDQPLRILGMLLDQPGQIVTREDIRRRLWPEGTVVEFEHSINAAVRRLRDALGDTAEKPRYVETVARRGYRFIGVLEPLPSPTETVSASDETPGDRTPTGMRRRLVIAGAMGVGLLVWIGIALRPTIPTERPVLLQVNLPPGTTPAPGSSGGSAISPDGRTIAFVVESGLIRSLWVRRLDGLEARQLPGTDGAALPFWSPDGGSLAFFAESKLKRISLQYGQPVIVADAPAPRGGAWSAADVIIFAPGISSALVQVAAAGGPVLPLTNFDPGDGSHRFPTFLPDGRRFLYFAGSSKPHVSGIYLSALDKPRERSQVIECPNAGAFFAAPGERSGYVLWPAPNGLMAQPFDPDRARVSGRPARVRGPQGFTVANSMYDAGFSVAPNGTILFDPEPEQYQSAWFSREGKLISASGPPERLEGLQLSADGNRALIVKPDSSGLRDVWRIELASAVQTRLTYGGRGAGAAWSPDGRRIAFHGFHEPRLWIGNSDGTGEAQAAVETAGAAYINDWSPDGRFLLYTTTSLSEGYDLWTVDVSSARGGDRQPVPYLKTHFNEREARFSPDGGAVAYDSDETGKYEVFVQSFPLGGGKWQISNGGCELPVWNRTGTELFCRRPDGLIMVTPVRKAARGFSFGTPTALFRARRSGTMTWTYDVAANGRILALSPVDVPTSLLVMTNWRAALEK